MKPCPARARIGRCTLALTALAALVGLAGSAAAQAPRVIVRRDVAYYRGRDADPVRHRLDLFLPADRRDFPVLVFIHGGAWMFGDKSTFGKYSAVGRFLAENGVGVVLPNYRLTPAVQHPEHIRDVARAFAWTARHIQDYGGDPNRLFVGGHSAGGHLSALLATDESYLKAEGLSRRAIRGVVAVSGVYRIPERLAFNLGGDNGGPDALVELGFNRAEDVRAAAPAGPPGPVGPAGMLFARLELAFNPFDLVFGKDPKVRLAASPVTHLCRGLPPFLILHADKELPLLSDMAEEFARTLKEHGCDATLVKVEDRRHTSIIFEATSRRDPAGGAILEFIERHGR